MRTRGRHRRLRPIAQYNATEARRPAQPLLLVGKRLRMQGFIVFDHRERNEEFLEEVGRLVRDGKMHYPRRSSKGVDNALDAFLGMLSRRQHREDDRAGGAGAVSSRRRS